MYKIETSKEEIIDILKAWITISLAFALILGNKNIFSIGFLINFFIATLTVGVGFLLHELAHKVLAQKYGAIAEFRAFNPMLLLALFMSYFLGVIFAAPGAVMIHGGNINIKRYGKISAVGPLTNLILALIFLAIKLLDYGGILNTIGSYGFMINSWLALFNMIPFWQFDGRKIFMWNKMIWVGITLISGLFVKLAITGEII